MSRTFNRFMVADDIGTNRKLRRLPVAHRWVYVAGVLALAAQSPIRGALLIADGEPATDDDVAMQATVPVKDARAALASFRKLGMLDRDKDDVEWVHDWDSMNKDPKPSDAPEATRDRKRRERAKSRANGAGVTRDMPDSHAPEVEEEEKPKGNDYVVPPLIAVGEGEQADDLTLVVDILSGCPRLVFDPDCVGVAAMLRAHPTLDRTIWANTAAARAADPTWRTTSAAKTLEFVANDLLRKGIGKTKPFVVDDMHDEAYLAQVAFRKQMEAAADRRAS